VPHSKHVGHIGEPEDPWPLAVSSATWPKLRRGPARIAGQEGHCYADSVRKSGTWVFLLCAGWLVGPGFAAGCSDGAAKEATGETSLPVCRASDAEQIADDVDTVCACIVEDITDVLRHSCIAPTQPKVLTSLAQLIFDDCRLNLGACSADMEDFHACSVAANVEFADSCSVGFPEECRSFALASGCAFYVGCPRGWDPEATGPGMSCVEQPASTANSEADAPSLGQIAGLLERSVGRAAGLHRSAAFGDESDAGPSPDDDSIGAAGASGDSENDANDESDDPGTGARPDEGEWEPDVDDEQDADDENGDEDTDAQTDE